jgi:SAM-dependent methyltransferase
MHESSYQRMAKFGELVKTRCAGREIRVLDVGSQDVNGTYKDFFSFEGVEYVGLDAEAGPNVDLVPRDPYDWTELEDDSFDVIVSGQALEHVEFPWLTMEQIARKLKPGGIACLIAPSRGSEHRYPVDCYRYLPDGMRALAKWSGLTVLETGLVDKTRRFKDHSEKWGDCHCILTKDGPLDDSALLEDDSQRSARVATSRD